MGVTRPYATNISVDEVSCILHDRAVCFSSILKAVHLCRYLYGFMTVTPYEQSYLDLLELLPGEEPENLQELYEAIDPHKEPWEVGTKGPPLPNLWKCGSTCPADFEMRLRAYVTGQMEAGGCTREETEPRWTSARSLWESQLSARVLADVEEKQRNERQPRRGAFGGRTPATPSTSGKKDKKGKGKHRGIPT